MQVTLKQSEIELALKNYVAQQGISLYGKDVSIAFTAGRKESGISAEINIDDSDIPGFTDSDLVGVAMPPAFLLKPVELVSPEKEAVAEPEPETEAVVVVSASEPETVVEVAAEPAKPSSLFG